MNKRAPITLAILLLTCAAAYAQSPDVQQIVNRMTQAQNQARQQLRPYLATRNYQIFKGEEKKTEVTAEVTYAPPQEKSFNITKSTGGTGEHVVKKTLEHEVEATRAPQAYDISPENYDFAYSGEESCHTSQCYVLELKPKRDCKDLVEGRVWVDKSTYLIHKLEGELAKSPSWWVKKALVSVEYGSIAGMWLQVRTVATAKLRMIGDYRMISHDTSLRTGNTVATNLRPNQSFRRRVAATALVSDSGFFAPHK